MNKSTLTQLYHQHLRRNASVPDVDIVLSLARGERPAEGAVTQMADSASAGDLLRFARDLEPASTQLNADLTKLFNLTPAHRRQQPSRRIAHATRRWRVAAALAASLIGAVALWTLHHAQVQTPMSAAVLAHSAAPSDRIFAGFNEKNIAASNDKRGDEIFRARFMPDEIFNSKGNDG